MNDVFNARVLVIDDEDTVRGSFRSILMPQQRDLSSLMALSAELFGEDACASTKVCSAILPRFQVDEADSGQSGLARVRQALAEERPYAVIFVDMRMPGWDGLETVQHIRALDHQAQIIFVTAYSDHTIEQVVSAAGPDVGYHAKPFAPEEILQLAAKAVYEWNKLRSLERLIGLIGSLQVDNSHLDVMLNYVLRHVTEAVGAEAAMVVRVDEDYSEPIQAIGSLADPETAQRLLTRLHRGLRSQQVERVGDVILFPMKEYRIATVLRTPSLPSREKLYLMDLFTRHAGQAIENARLHARLVEREKLSAIGMAMSHVAHDLRSLLGTIPLAIDNASSADEGIRQRAHGMIVRAAEDALRLVDDILDYAHNAPVVREQVAAESVLEDLHAALADALVRQGVQLVCTTSHAAPLWTNRHKLVRALSNLISNAAESMALAGTATARVEVAIALDADCSVITVADHGPGIPEAIGDSLFQPFVTHGKPRGIGLGLAIVHQIVEAHGGRITVGSRPGGGASFRIELPLRGDE